MLLSAVSVTWRGVRSVIVSSVCVMARCKKCFVAALDWLAESGSAEYYNSGKCRKLSPCSTT